MTAEAVVPFYRFYMSSRKHTATKTPICRVGLDRLMLSGEPRSGSKIEEIAGYKLTADFCPRAQGALSTYARVRNFHSISNSAEIVVKYKPRRSWLKPMHITMIADDPTGIPRDDFDAVIQQCSTYRFSMLEISFDFSPESGVDREFVRRHGLFGKSQRDRKRGGPDQLRYGSRGSSKLVRCYWKSAINRYRVEPELHSAFLRKYRVSDVADIGALYGPLLRAHCHFMRISWNKLGQHLNRKFGRDGQKLLDGARDRGDKSLRSALRFLKNQGVTNTHRFLRPLRMNDDIASAFRTWLDSFVKDEDHALAAFKSGVRY